MNKNKKRRVAQNWNASVFYYHWQIAQNAKCWCVVFVWCELCLCVCVCLGVCVRGVGMLFPLPLLSWIRAHPQYMYQMYQMHATELNFPD
jgi:hypothetical protein